MWILISTKKNSPDHDEFLMRDKLMLNDSDLYLVSVNVQINICILR